MEKLTEGYVKGVLSGDLIVISGKIKKNSDEAPEEKNLFLTFVSAPKINSQTSYEEEPGAWDSRNFLRKLLIGRVVKYTEDYASGDNSFGQVYFEGKNINIEVIKNGFGRVSTNKSNESLTKSEFFSKVKAAEAEAQGAKAGIWKAGLTSKVKITKSDEVDHKALFEQIKGKEVDAMLEVAFNCTAMLVLLPEHNCVIKATLRFVALPSKETFFYRAGKAYVERLFAHRDAKIKVHHLEDKNYVIDLWDIRKNPSTGKDEKKDLALTILSNGYSKLYIPSTFSNDKIDTDSAREAQTSGQSLGLRVWEGFKPREVQPVKSNTTSEKLSDFEGVCYTVHSGDSISVKADDGTITRIFLSHIRAPVFAKPNTDEEDKPWAWQSKEFLRKTAIGKRIKVIYDYSKETKDARQMHYYSVFIDSTNINAAILEAGYANYAFPKPNDLNISKFVSDYENADRAAKGSKKGVHSDKPPGIPGYCDLIQANPKKKKEFIARNANLARGVPCVVEHVFTAIRTKLRIDRTTCFIPFKLIGLKCVENDKNNTKQLNELFLKGSDFVADQFMQREGIVDIVHHDKNGNYFGFLTIGGVNVGASLLKEGHAIIHNPQATPLSSDYKKAEEIAADKKVGIWAHSGLSQILKETDVVNTSEVSTIKVVYTPKNENIKIRITDLIDLKKFYANVLPNKSLSTIEKVLGYYDEGEKTALPLEPPIKKGTICIAKYQADLKHYRVKITAILKDETCEVDFIDYGTVDIIPKRNLFKMDESIGTIEPQVVECELANLKFSKNSHKKALSLYPNFIDLEKSHSAKIVYSTNAQKPKLGVVIYFGKGSNLTDSIQHDLISKGFASIDEKKPLHDSLIALKEVQKKAKSSGIGRWTEGEESEQENDATDD